MNKFKFLRVDIPTIWLTIVLCLIYSYFDEKSTWWFMTLECLLVYFAVNFIDEKTLEKFKRSEEFTNRLTLTYKGNLNELISDFRICDLFFDKKIGDCYAFSSKRSLWYNQMFFVEKIGGVLHIVSDQYSLKQLKQHPLSSHFIVKFTGQIKEADNNDNFSRILFDKTE